MTTRYGVIVILRHRRMDTELAGRGSPYRIETALGSGSGSSCSFARGGSGDR